MPRTPYRTPLEDFIVTPGDIVRGEDDSSGGDVLIRGGNSTLAGNDGADLTLQGGENTNGTPGNTNGGNVFLTPGAGTGTGVEGLIVIGNSGALQFTERASVPGPSIVGTQGRVWVRSDSPNSLIFTDDAGTDWVLNSSSSGSATGLPGNIYNNLQFYVDAADRNSYPGTGSSVVDLEGNGTAGTLTTATYSAGAFNFNGTSGMLSFTKNAAITDIFDGGGTVVVFIRPTSGGESGGFIVGSADVAVTTSGWYLSIRDNANNRSGLEFRQNFSTTDGQWRTFDQASAADPTPLSAFSGVRPFGWGQWNAVAVVYDSSATANDPVFYINGTQWTTTLGIDEITGPSGTFQTDAGNDLIVGNAPGDNRTWGGDIALVLMFDRALSSAEVLQVQSLFANRFGLGLFGSPRSTGHGQNIVIQAGAASSTSSDMFGGSVSILGGDQTAASFSTGGDILIRAGRRTTTTNARGGNLTLQSGSGGQPSFVTISAGAMTGTTSGSSQSVFIQGANSLSSGDAGGILIQGGDAAATASNGEGGDVEIRGGLGDFNAGGDIILRSGGQVSPNTAGTTGDITLTTDRNGTGGTTTNTGNISLSTSGGGATSTVSGNISITTGTTAAASANNPGDISITGGSFTVANNNVTAGQITLTAGNGTALSGGGGGSINLVAGNNTNTGTITTAFAGNVVLTAGTMSGTGGSAVGGTIDINGGAGAGTNTTGGPVNIDGGTGTGTGAGGTVSVSGGPAGATGTGGALLISGGSGGATSGEGGAITITGGPANGASDGGDLLIRGGTAGTTGAGGAVDIFARSGGGTSGNGGQVTLNAGHATNGTAGSITITAGTATVGTSGSVALVTVGGTHRVEASGAITQPELGSSPNPGASRASFFTRSSDGAPMHSYGATPTVRELVTDAQWEASFGAAAGSATIAGSQVTFVSGGDNDAIYGFFLPNGYVTGTDLVVEIMLNGDGAASASADFEATISRTRAGDVVGVAGTTVAFTGTTIPATNGEKILATATMTGGALASLQGGDAFLLTIERLGSTDSYTGSVLMGPGRIRTA